MTKERYLTQQAIAAVLDRAADRAEYVDREPATKKQCWFLAGLMLDAGQNDAGEFEDYNAILTKRRASTEIKYYLEERKAETAAAPEVAVNQ